MVRRIEIDYNIYEHGVELIDFEELKPGVLVDYLIGKYVYNFPLASIRKGIIGDEFPTLVYYPNIDRLWLYDVGAMQSWSPSQDNDIAYKLFFGYLKTEYFITTLHVWDHTDSVFIRAVKREGKDIAHIAHEHTFPMAVCSIIIQDLAYKNKIILKSFDVPVIY